MAGEEGASFGARLRGLREAAGLTQEQLAERAGLTAKGIAALERGRRQRPYPHTVRALADALGLDEGGRAALAGAPAPAGVPPAAERPPLPIAPTPLIGRDDDVAALVAALRDVDAAAPARLITLTGPGGVGKTRLALAVAADAAGWFPDGVAPNYTLARLQWRYPDGGAAWNAWREATVAWREAIDEAYPTGFWDAYARLRDRDPAGLEAAIAFLEADPWFF